MSEDQKRPLVTFAVFAYNQEKYIREAVEGALAQKFEPLEIILSDDCSTDRTFEIMQKIAASYQGPHKVQTIRQDINLGTLNHVITVARLARGDLFVVNAGDDISYPQRTEELVRCWQLTGAPALSSFHDEISDDGNILKKNYSFPVSRAIQIIFGSSKVARRVEGYVQNVPGFAAAYERVFWSQLPLSSKKILIEDGIASAILNIRGEKIERVKKSLISYRMLSSSLSVRQSEISRREIIRREEKINVTAKNIVHMTDYILSNANPPTGVVEPSVVNGLEKGRHYGLIVQDFWEDNAIKKFNRFLKIKSREEFMFLASRIFGFNMFILLKIIQLKVSI